MLIIIPVGNVTDVVFISPSPAELLPATLIVYAHIPNWFRKYSHVVEDVVFCVTSSSP